MIRTHVDDLKVSSRSYQQIQLLIQQLKGIYKEITVHEGATPDYLGMIMTYDAVNQSVKIDMVKYSEECIKDFEEDEPGIRLKEVATPANDNMFKTRDGEVEKLEKEQATNFHATVAKLLLWQREDDQIFCWQCHS